MRTIPTAGTEWWRAVAADGLVLPATTDSPVPFRALMVFTFIMLLSPQTYIPGLAQLRIALLTGVFAVVAHCWTRFVAGRPLIRFTRETWLAAGLFGWAAATLPFSMWPGGSLQILLDLYVKALIVFWLLSNTVTTLGRLRGVAWGLSLMAMPLAATAVWNFRTGYEFKDRIVGYAAALTTNPNDTALMLNLILPLMAALFVISSRPSVRLLLASLIALAVSAIVVTFSRGGFLVLATILVLGLRRLYKSGRRTWAVAALIMVVAVAPLLPAGYLDRLSTITDINADPTGSGQNRWMDTQTAFAFMLVHPFGGAGIGMNLLALNDLRGATWHTVHNVYLEYGMDLGWPGLGLFLLLLISCIRTVAHLRDRYAHPPTHDLSVLAEAIQISLVGFAVSGFFYPVAYNFYFYYFGALAVAAGGICETELRIASEAAAAAVKR